MRLKPFLFTLLLLCGSTAFAQTPVQVAAQGNATLTVCSFPASGNPCTNPVTVYSDSALMNVLTQPISVNSGGVIFYVTVGSNYTGQFHGARNDSIIIYGGSSGGGGSLSGMTAGQFPVAATATTVTSSVASTGSGNVVLSTSPTLVTPALGTPSSATLTNATGYLWNNIFNPSGNLSLTMGSNSSTFNTTSAVSDYFSWANTTAAVVGTSQSSPVLSLYGTEFHAAASVKGGICFQFQPGNGTDANGTINILHCGTATGVYTTAFSGPIQAGAAAAPGALNLPGNASGSCSVVANNIGLCAPASSSFTNYSLQLSATGPAAAGVLLVGAPSSNVSAITYGTVPNSSLTNSAITIAGTSVALGGSTSSLPSPGAIGGTTPSTGAFTSITNTPASTSVVAAIDNNLSGTTVDIHDFQVNAVTKAVVDKNGVVTSGAASAECTTGTGAGYCGAEGTAPTGTSTVYGAYNDSTLHCVALVEQTKNAGCAAYGARIALTSDWTCGTGGTVTSCSSAIVGTSGSGALTITLPLSALNWHWQCEGVVGQATAAVANTWLFQTGTNAPTNMEATYQQGDSATTFGGGATTGTSTTTATAIGGNWTLGGTATKMPFRIQGTIEGASASGTTISLLVTSGSNSDLITIYRGTYCSVGSF